MRLGKNGKLIRLSKSCLSSLEKIYVCKVLDKEFLGMGEEVNLFEKKLTFFLKEVLCVLLVAQQLFNWHYKLLD